MAAPANRAVDLNHPVKERHHYDPCILVIFGGAGDLSHRKLIPASYNLLLDGELPDKFAILGFSMEDLDDEKYRAFALSGIEQFSRRPVENEHWAKFAPLLHFNRGSFSEAADYQNLHKRCEALDAEFGTEGNRVFYFAIPPAFIDTCSEGLTAAGMIHPHEKGHPFTRVVVEKPIGSDLASASEINAELARHFDESQIFRIDHYLGKETVENLMVLRFANAILEPIWTARFVDHVQITVAEAEGVGTRAAYYDRAGALRDMVQSHLLQTLCMIATEPPNTTGAESMRDAKLDVLRALRPLGDEDIEKWVVRGQYGEGLIGGMPVAAYRAEEQVAPDSQVETFVALRCWIDNWRWAGVPFYLRTGKRLARKITEIAVTLKPVPHLAFSQDGSLGVQPNQLVLTLQPNEGVSLRLGAKIPGTRMIIRPVNMEFQYGTAFLSQSPEAYERLITDAMRGDATLFTRNDEVEAQWRICDPIIDAWARDPGPLPSYQAGSQGPREAEGLLRDDDRWRAI